MAGNNVISLGNKEAVWGSLTLAQLWSSTWIYAVCMKYTFLRECKDTTKGTALTKGHNSLT